MKVLFIESRTQTEQWDKVAQLLGAKDGVSIHWIVCSKVVTPTSGRVRVIPFPSNSSLQPIDAGNADLLEVRAADRVIKHYGGGDEHYNYYWDSLYREIQEIKPDIVFGELANFHTHMAQRICKILGVEFYQPSTVRYPSKRFGFYKHDRLELTELNRKLSEEEIKLADETAKKIAAHNIQPDYMRAPPSTPSQVKHKLSKYWFKFELLRQRVFGDVYNVPSLLAVVNNGMRAKSNLRKWIEDEVGIESLSAEKKKILLYPLQMQPEFNLDVWGREFNCQAQLISEIKSYLNDDWVLAIKLNPKSFLELDDSVLAIKGVIRLPYHSKMNDILPAVDAVITVTGTIAIECSVRKFPVFVLSQGDFATLPGAIHLSEVKQIREIDKLVEGARRTEEGVNPILRLVKDSYPGVIGERITNPSSLSDENIKNLHAAFLDFIFRNEQKKDSSV